VAVCVKAPEVPVKVTVALPTVAFAAAVSVTLCAVPGVSVSVGGFAVTPAGNPLNATVTVPVNPFAATASTLTGFPVAPAWIDRVAGVAVSEKFAAAVTVNATVAVCVKAPEVPVKVTVALPTVAFAAAVSVTLCAVPGVNVSDVGFAVTPVGSPLIATVTVPVNPFAATASTLTGFPAAPAWIDRVAGVAVKEKLGSAVVVSATVAVCFRVPEVPVNVTVALPTVAFAAAVSVTFCAVPGVSVSEAGFAVTPDGRPLIATFTVPVKPFEATASTLISSPAPPSTSDSVPGVAVNVKFAAAACATVKSTLAIWLRAPEVPVKVTVGLPAAAFAAAVMVTLCAVPGVSISDVGFAVTPVGSPLIATDTIPEKPFAATASTLTGCPVPPAVSEMVPGKDVSEKFGAGAAAVMFKATVAVRLRDP
jgi:hypothetical protein